MAKVTLQLDDDFDSEVKLFGIVCTDPIYSFCWKVNTELNMAFQQSESIIINKKDLELEYAVYATKNEEPWYELHIIENNANRINLLPKLKGFDLLLRIACDQDDCFSEEVPAAIREINSVSLVTEIDHKELRKLNITL